MSETVREILTTVLVIDHQPEIRRLVRSAFAKDAYRVYEALSGIEGLDMAGLRNPNLIFTETTMPDMSGAAIVRSVREWSDTPIIALSEDGNEDSIVGVLEAGANDYIVKPFGVPELVARARAKLRTSRQGAEEAALPVLEQGPLKIDFVKRQLYLRNQRVHLTPAEYRIASLLLRRESKVVRHEELIAQAAGHKRQMDHHGLRVYIGYLRRKLSQGSDGEIRIDNESRIGYRLTIREGT